MLIPVLSRKGTRFNPSKVPGLDFWMDPSRNAYSDAGSTLATDDDAVQQWTDRSSNARVFSQTTAGKKPTFKTNIVSGNPVIRFDGGDLLTSSNFSSNTAGTIFAVYNLATAGSAETLLSTSDETLTTKFWRWHGFRNTGDPDIFYAYRNANGQNTVGGNTTALASDTWYIGVIRSTGSAVAFWVNGVSQNIEVVGGSNDGGWWGDVDDRDNFVLGALKTSSESSFLSGDLAMMFSYNSALSDGTRQRLERYCSIRFGIALP